MVSGVAPGSARARHATSVALNPAPILIQSAYSTTEPGSIAWNKSNKHLEIIGDTSQSDRYGYEYEDVLDVRDFTEKVFARPTADQPDCATRVTETSYQYQ